MLTCASTTQLYLLVVLMSNEVKEVSINDIRGNEYIIRVYK